MVLVIDNYDSFTHNLVQYLAELGAILEVKRPHQLSLQEIVLHPPKAILLSPGPGKPEDATLCLEILQHFAYKLPILGVCLGHQCLAVSTGGRVVRATNPIHGKASEIFHDQCGLFEKIPSPTLFGRYHSLVVARDTLPDTLEVSAYTADGEIMGLRLKHSRTESVQFHPESILSPFGKQLLSNFLQYVDIEP